MVFYEILQSLGQTFHQAAVTAWMMGVKVGAGALTGTMGNGLFAASWEGEIPGVGRLVSCAGVEPDRRLVQVVGAGSSGGRSWDVWRITSWSDPRQALSEDERGAIAGRVAFLESVLAEWDRLHALNPGAPMRDVSAQRDELEELRGRLAPIGSLFVVAYVGYGKRWGRGAFVLPR